jgi:quercetin dioxygenase-like cupin family protein
LRDEPFTTIGDHVRVVLRGRILARLNGHEDIFLEEGDAIWMKAGERYGGCNPGDDDAEFIAASSALPISLSHLAVFS